MTKKHSGGIPQPDHASSFRPDIEGLRSIAIGLVLAFSAGISQVPGGFVGVDVFFVISGFLITGLLVSEVESTGRVSLRRFYARRAKRLLPATGVVLAATALLTWLTASVVEWRTFGLDIISSALYVVNWRLAGPSRGDLADGLGVSPVQHFWPLAVQEQFYIVWPLLLALMALFLRKKPGLGTRPVMTAGVLVVLVPSFIWSIHYTSSNPTQAFFVTPTRLWELGIGALVALGAAAWMKLPRSAAITLGWAGLVAVVASGFLITASTAFPGYVGLAPTLGTAAVIIAGFASGKAGPAGLLSWRPAVWTGGLSYSLYLWHWPLIVAATAHWGELGVKWGLLVIAVSFVPAYLTKRLIENPIRCAEVFSRSDGLAVSMGINFTAVGAASGLFLVLMVPAISTPQVEPAARATSYGVDPEAGTVEGLPGVRWYVPDPTAASEDVPPAHAERCMRTGPKNGPVRCDYGDLDGETTIVVAGDSKMLQYESALSEISQQEGWHVISFTKSACGFHTGMQVRSNEPDTNCATWNERVLSQVLDLDPDLVITSQGRSEALTNPQDPGTLSRTAMINAIANRWQELDDVGIPVAVIIDNPAPDLSVYRCVANNPDDLTKCTFDRREGIERSAAQVQRAAASLVENATRIDVNDLICPARQCVPVVGNVLIYRQTSHLTNTYVRTLVGALRKQLVPVVEDLS